MLVIGLDCGGREEGSHAGTGLSVVEFADTITVHEARQVNWDEWTLGGLIQDYVARYDPDKVIYESFIPRWGQKFELDTVYLNGALKASVLPSMLAAVSPSAHKSLIKRDWAKQLVLDAGFKVEEGHKVDSTSLCLYYGITQQNKTALGEYKKWLSKNSK